jgi:hypothetical protein
MAAVKGRRRKNRRAKRNGGEEQLIVHDFFLDKSMDVFKISGLCDAVIVATIGKCTPNFCFGLTQAVKLSHV